MEDLFCPLKTSKAYALFFSNRGIVEGLLATGDLVSVMGPKNICKGNSAEKRPFKDHGRPVESLLAIYDP